VTRVIRFKAPYLKKSQNSIPNSQILNDKIEKKINYTKGSKTKNSNLKNEDKNSNKNKLDDNY
jgi:hypothetical protein